MCPHCGRFNAGTFGVTVMKLYWKKQIINPYTIGVVIVFPVLTFLLMGFDTGMLPKFWKQMYPGESAAGANLWIVAHMRHLVTYVEMMEWYVSYDKYFIPILSSLAVIPFIRMREGFLPLAYVRMKSPRKTEQRWIVKSVFLAGGVIYGAYLLTMLVMRWWCVNTYNDNSCFDFFVNQWGWSLSAAEHPYLYILVLGAMRCFLMPLLMALLTVAVSYLTNKIYIYLLVPAVYNLIVTTICSQNTYKDKWPLPLFSPENFMIPMSGNVWGFGHDVHGIWSVVGASLMIIIPCILMIWYGMRKRRA